MSSSSSKNTNKYAKNIVLGTFGALGLFAVGTQSVKADTVKVQAGDTVWDFAQKYGISVSDIEAQNTNVKKISSSVDLIYAGQTLTLSSSTSTSGQNSSAVSSTTSAVSSTASAAAVDGKYTVQAGDTLSELSARFGISVATLQQINQLSDSNLIVAGQTLSVTSAASAASSASSASNTSATSAAEQTATEDSAASAASSTTNSSEAVASSANTTATSSTASSTAASSATSSSKTSTTTSSSSTSTTQQSTASSATSTASSTSNNSNLATGSVVSLAVKLANANIPYVWGGNSLSGMDCSGLVQYVYANADGISLPHNTVAQEAYVTKHSVASAKPGDILFWGNSGATYHDAIYIGNNQFVAAPSTGQNVKVQTISSYFMPSFAGTVK
ncbi:LysM peptidoglycan-binding domain-containing protein [Paucilactobacillus wasatchensis]|uniref:Cell wall-associated hydrolase n=1 Tax=Paucilactobacillus wasatchensis TaxID=1335616 RepID=A0A0D0Y466_9LACO|nr:LysM peptidoglycan-binding domain-containing protein [Paucilactobacillus wasatchensis]KIS03058.1 Cell wall-associated hydrolase [Paucilactobacillus wasatchensis]